MSEIEDTEKSLRDFAATRQKFAGPAPLRIPGPMRERLRLEIEAMSVCDSVFERKSGFGIAALLRILIPTAAVATVAVVSFQSWELNSMAPSGAKATASLQKDSVDLLAADQALQLAQENTSQLQPPARERLIAATAAPMPAVPLATAAAVPAQPMVFRETSAISSTESEGALEEAAGLTIAMNNRASSSPGLTLDNVQKEKANRGELALAEPTSPGYGEPREATLAPTVPVDMAKQLNEPVATLRFRSTAPGAVLSRFALRRVGDVIELTDSDGSRYTATENALPRMRKTLEKSDAQPSRSAGEATVEHFTVTGVNQTISRKVLITGSVFESPIDRDMAFRSSAAAAPKIRIHAVIRIEGQSEPMAIEADLD